MTTKLGPTGGRNLAAVIGASVGSISCLFAIGVAPAILEKSARLLIAHPTIGLFGFFVGGVVGGVSGAFLGIRLARASRLRRSYVTGGVVGGILPFAFFVLLGWFLWTH